MFNWGLFRLGGKRLWLDRQGASLRAHRSGLVTLKRRAGD